MKVVVALGLALLAIVSGAAQRSTDINAPNVRMKIRTITFDGANKMARADLRSIVHDLLNFKFDHAPNCSDDYVREVIRDRFQQYGYFKAVVAAPRCKIVSRELHDAWMDVTVRVDPGAVFHVKEVTFSGPKAYSTDELRHQIPISQGDLLRTGALRTGLKNLREMYCHAGYLNFIPVPNTDVDDANLTVSVHFDLEEGDKFFYRNLIVDGEEFVPGARQKLLDAWQPYNGKPYDCGESLKQFLRDIHARQNVKPEDVLKISSNGGAHTVDIGITLAKPATSKTRYKRSCREITLIRTLLAFSGHCGAI